MLPKVPFLRSSALSDLAPLPDHVPRNRIPPRKVFTPSRSDVKTFNLRRKMIPRYVDAYVTYMLIKGWMRTGADMPEPTNGALENADSDGVPILWNFMDKDDLAALTSSRDLAHLSALSQSYNDPNVTPYSLHNEELLAFMVDVFRIPFNESVGYSAFVQMRRLALKNWWERERRKLERRKGLFGLLLPSPKR